MDTKLRSTKHQYKVDIIYLLIAVFLAIAVVLLFELKTNANVIFPSYIYTDSDVSVEVNNFIGKSLDYVLNYKNDEYVNDKSNITETVINSYRQQLEEQIESEFQSFKSIKESSQSFNELDYDKQEKILLEERKKIEEKYTLEEEKIIDKIFDLRKNSYENLITDLNSYKNLKFAAYDSINDAWIGIKDVKEDEIKNNSRFYMKRNTSTNNTKVESIFINGKKSYNFSLYDTITRIAPGDYSTENYSSEDTQNQLELKTVYLDGKYDIDLYVWIPKNLVSSDSIYNAFESIKELDTIFYIKASVFLLSLVMLITLLFILKRVNKENAKNKVNMKSFVNNKVNMIVEKIKKWPIELKLGALYLVYFFRVAFFSVDYYNNYLGYFNYLSVGNVLWIAFIFTLAYIIIKSLIISYKEGTLLKNNITSKVIHVVTDVMSRGSIIKNIFLSMVIYGIMGVSLLFLALISGGTLFPICFIAGIIMTIALIILAIKKLLYLDKIMVGAKLGAEGKLSCNIEERGSGLFRELAHNINNIKEGLRESIKNEMKSERMKSELITNVSHDLKTPLTSIINYIDLLKREDLEPEVARDYVRILDTKSQRLKTLIEDLFEASKAASGEMKLNIERLDVVQLLKQTLGEYDERLKECSLEVKVNIPNEKIYVNGDGKRLFRVFENLISNITKYSLNNTRVYIDVINNSEEVTITMKNISSYELNFDAMDITNRFKRGDEARSTEGSGLGLAIAKSIVELHSGEFIIEVDGDLFKSTIKLGCV